MKVGVLDHGYVALRNVSGPIRRPLSDYDADDRDPANAARFSFDAADRADRTRAEDMKLAAYLMRNRHNTPIEMIEVWLEMKLPIFVARQFVRHRTVSINEVSARYVQLPNEFYVPDPATVGVKAATNKQGREIEEANENAHAFCASLRRRSEEAYVEYETALAFGVPNELARLHLPLNIYTKWLWKQDLHNLLHFLNLRLDPHAQFEARSFARAVHELLYRVLPETMKLFDEQRGV